MEIIWKPANPSDFGPRLAFSSNEQAAFLTANSQHQEWRVSQRYKEADCWKRTDGATAIYSTTDNQMVFGCYPKR
jgi:hypothetical protein